MIMTEKDKSFILLILSSIIVAWFIFSVFRTAISKANFDEPYSHKIIAGNSSSDWLNLSQNITPKDLRNRIILLDFWTYACVNCLQTVPEIAGLEEEFGDNLTVIGVHSGKFDNEKLLQSIKDAVIKYDIRHPVINDADLTIWQSFKVSAWPTLILLNPEGEVDKIYRGEGNIEKLRSDIKRLIKKFKYSLNTGPLPITLEKNKITGHILQFPTKLEFASDVKYGGVVQKPLIFIANSGDNNIIASSLRGEILFTIGSKEKGFRDGTIESAAFNAPRGLLYKDQILYIADTGNHALRKVDFNSGNVSTVAGSGARGFIIGDEAKAQDTDLASPWDLEFFPDKNNIIIANAGTHQLLKYDLKKDTISPFAGNGIENIIDGIYPENSLAQPSGLSSFNQKLYFVDAETSSLRVADVKGNVQSLIGSGLFKFGYKNGTKDQALMQHPLGVLADDTGIYVADSYNHVIRKYNLSSEKIEDYSGLKIKGSQIETLKNTAYNEPEDIISILTKFYIADTNNHRIVVIDRNNDKASILNVMPPLKLPKGGLLEYLPNLEKIPSQIVKSNTPITLSMPLKEGWKINELGPSFFNLVEITGNNQANLIKHYDWKEIKSSQINLPKLSSKNEYYLQGTVYYCKDAVNALCLVHSYEQKLQPSQNGKETHLEIEFVYD